MSWDAELVDDRDHVEGTWNYTNNCNAMANAIVDGDDTWWKQLDGMEGPEGAAFLDKIIKGLMAHPERFRAMNPANGWGDYDSFVKVLTEMRDSVPEWPTKWEVCG